MQSVNVIELSKLLKSSPVYILDVRQSSEFEFANIGGTHIPLDQLSGRVNELPRDTDIYCLCHHGVRSSYACSILIENGLDQVFNIEGGIDSWSLVIDASIKRY